MIALTLRWFDLLYAHESGARHDARVDRRWGLELQDELEGYIPSPRPSSR